MARTVSTVEQQQWYALLCAEQRRYTRNAKLPERMHASVPREVAPAAVAPALPAPAPTMSLPACLCMGDTAASIERRRAVVLQRDFWVQGSMPRAVPTMPARRAGRFASLYANA